MLPDPKPRLAEAETVPQNGNLLAEITQATSDLRDTLGKRWGIPKKEAVQSFARSFISSKTEFGWEVVHQFMTVCSELDLNPARKEVAAFYDPNKGLTMSRNPHFKVWSEAAMPDGYPDVVQYDFGLTDEAEVTAVMNGEADWMFDQPPTDRLGEIGTKYKDQVYINTLTAWWYAPMNTRIAPFDNIKARQAVNYAIDRKALVNLFGGPVLAAPVCQVLPPGFPAHVAYCPYTKDPGEKWSAPDIEKAKQLVEESGTKGQKVTVIVEDTAVSKSIGVYLQSVLKEIGYDADLKPISPNIQFTYIQNTNNKVQISVSQWYQDYPAASNFLNVLFGCSSFTEGSDSSINIAGFCDEKVEAKMKEAFALAATDPEGANKIWTEVDRMVTDAAPAAPLFTPKHIDFVSKRLGNFQFNAQFYWMVTQSWVQ
jgi:peptide/nickel transport system substrate-binding protein